MRCPDCNKFVSYDTEVDPEVNSEDVEHEIEPAEGNEPAHGRAMLSIEVRRVLTCGDCGTELKESTFEFNEDIIETCACYDGDDNPASYSIDVDASPTMSARMTDRRGKAITNPRYQATLYGVEVTATVKCDECGESWTKELSDQIEASSFDELT